MQKHGQCCRNTFRTGNLSCQRPSSPHPVGHAAKRPARPAPAVTGRRLQKRPRIATRSRHACCRCHQCQCRCRNRRTGWLQQLLQALLPRVCGLPLCWHQAAGRSAVLQGCHHMRRQTAAAAPAVAETQAQHRAAATAGLRVQPPVEQSDQVESRCLQQKADILTCENAESGSKACDSTCISPFMLCPRQTPTRVSYELTPQHPPVVAMLR